MAVLMHVYLLFLLFRFSTAEDVQGAGLFWLQVKHHDLQRWSNIAHFPVNRCVLHLTQPLNTSWANPPDNFSFVWNARNRLHRSLLCQCRVHVHIGELTEMNDAAVSVRLILSLPPWSACMLTLSALSVVTARRERSQSADSRGDGRLQEGRKEAFGPFASTFKLK